MNIKSNTSIHFTYYVTNSKILLGNLKVAIYLIYLSIWKDATWDSLKVRCVKIIYRGGELFGEGTKNLPFGICVFPIFEKKCDTILIFIFIMCTIQFSWITAFDIRYRFYVLQSEIFFTQTTFSGTAACETCACVCVFSICSTFNWYVLVLEVLIAEILTWIEI